MCPCAHECVRAHEHVDVCVGGGVKHVCNTHAHAHMRMRMHARPNDRQYALHVVFSLKFCVAVEL